MPIATSEALNLGLQFHAAGQLAEASRICQQVLAGTPDQPEALHLLGLIAHQQGDSDLAADLITRAIDILPAASFYGNLGAIRHSQGRFEEAAAAYQRALDLGADPAQTHNSLGRVLLDNGQAEQAQHHFELSLGLRPGYVEAHAGLADALRSRGEPAEAAHHYEAAIAISPDLPRAHLWLGVIRHRQGDVDAAVPHWVETARLEPDNFDAYLNLGEGFRLLGRLDEARAACRRAVELNPNHFGAHLNLGMALNDAGRVDEAVLSFKRSLALNPEAADAHLALGLAALRTGDFERGWAEYEWRWQSSEMTAPETSQPRWDGSALAGRTLLVHSEQGFGDTLQFVRYLPLIRQEHARVVLYCQRELSRLLASSLEDVQVVSPGEAVPAFDVYAPLLSLPNIVKTTFETIPTSVPYLRAKPELADRWRKVLGKGDHLKVGLAWASNTGQRTAGVRSLNAELLAPLSEIAGIRWFSLQKGSPAKEASLLPSKMSLTYLGPDLADFADTAAVVSQLDLLISIDTSIAHVAGALARPVWLLLPFVSDWRWLLDREDSPWYSTMRLFRQEKPGDWAHVIDRVAACLRALMTPSPATIH